MDEFLRMDVFFVIATLGVIIFTAFVSIFLFYAIQLARTLSRIALDVEAEAHALKEDIDEARILAKREGRQLLHLVDVALKAGKRLVAPSRKKRAS